MAQPPTKLSAILTRYATSQLSLLPAVIFCVCILQMSHKKIIRVQTGEGKMERRWI